MSTLPALPLPLFALDGTHRAALVVGRAKELGPISREDIERFSAAAVAEAEKHALPLAVVCAAHAEGDEIYCGCAAGLVLAASEEDAPVTVDKALLARSIADVPASFWAALEAAGLTFPSSEDEDEEYPSTGTFVTPAGWSIASLYLGERGVDEVGSPTGDAERVATSAAEDSAPPTVLKARVAEKILASEKSLVLHATYC